MSCSGVIEVTLMSERHRTLVRPSLVSLRSTEPYNDMPKTNGVFLFMPLGTNRRRSQGWSLAAELSMRRVT